MKKVVVLFLSVLMLFSMGMTGYAQTAVVCNMEDRTLLLSGWDTLMPMANCSHPSLERITENETRYVQTSGSLHTKQIYFTARCIKCMKYQKEIIDRSEVEPHTMVLVISECNEITKTHRYVYKCEGKCEIEDEVVKNCSGTHAVIMQGTQVTIE